MKYRNVIFFFLNADSYFTSCFVIPIRRSVFFSNPVVGITDFPQAGMNVRLEYEVSSLKVSAWHGVSDTG